MVQVKVHHLFSSRVLLQLVLQVHLFPFQLPVLRLVPRVQALHRLVQHQLFLSFRVLRRGLQRELRQLAVQRLEQVRQVLPRQVLVGGQVRALLRERVPGPEQALLRELEQVQPRVLEQALVRVLVGRLQVIFLRQRVLLGQLPPVLVSDLPQW